MVHCKEIMCPRLFGNTYISGKNDFICNGLDSMQSQAFAIQTGHKNVSQSVPNLIKKSQNGDGDQVTWYNALSSYVYRTTDYGHMMTSSQILYSPKPYPNPKKKIL